VHAVTAGPRRRSARRDACPTLSTVSDVGMGGFTNADAALAETAVATLPGR
jgi:hypothetical protein